MFLYFLKVTICWLVFYLVYSKFLSKETFFKTNRWYLLGTLLLGAGIPLLEFLPIFQEDNPVVVYFQPISDGSYYVQSAVNEAVTNNVLDWNKMFLGIYIIGVVVASSRFIIGLGKIYRLYRDAEIIQKENHTLVLTNQPHLPFSFFKYMFWSKDLEMNDVDGQKIVTHEVAHVKGWHSVDVILLEIFSIIFWVSPMVYFYKKSLKTVHEYLADAVVLQTTPTKKYGHLLLRQSQSGLQIALANHFFHSQLKQRIVMMTRSKSRKEAIVKYLFALPVILLLLIAFSKKEAIANMQDGKPFIEVDGKKSDYYEQVRPENFDTKKVKSEYENLAKKYQDTDFDIKENEDKFLREYVLLQSSLGFKFPMNTKEVNEIGSKFLDEFNLPHVTSVEQMIEVFKRTKIEHDVDEMPRFSGCEDKKEIADRNACSQKELFSFIYKNVKYPKAASKAGIEGKVVISFVVQKDGTIGKAKIKKDIGGGCGEEALRVINAMPKWIPGTKDGKAVDVEMAIPVMFKLSDDSEKADNSINDWLEKGIDKIVIDDKEATEKELKSYSPDEIATINIGKHFEVIEGKKEPILTKVLMVKTKSYKSSIVDQSNKGTVYLVDGVEVDKMEAMAIPKDEILFETEKQATLTKDGKKILTDVFLIETKNPKKNGKEESYDNIQFEYSVPSQSSTSSDEIYKVVEEMPRFKNDDCEKMQGDKERKKCAESEMLKFIYTNVNYPKAASKAGIQGRVIIQFVVQKDGSIADAKVLRDPGGGCGEEAQRVVNLMPKWIPGKQKGKSVSVSYTLPVSFKLAEPDPNEAVKIDENNIKLNKDMKPLFIVDGVEFDKSAAGELKPDDIATVNVLKGEKATAKYGDKGKNGVVEITLKNENSKSAELRTHPVEKKTALESSGLTYVRISPNPTNGKINIEYGSQEKPMTISIFDINGKRVYEKEVVGGISSLQNVDLSKEAKGVFLVTFQQDGKTYKEKVVLQ